MDALRIVRKGMLSFTVGNLVVTRIDVNIIFKVEHKHSHSTGRRLLIDPAGNPILTLPRLRWQVFRGDSKESRDLIFSAKRSSGFQLKTTLHVFLANNTTENAPDLKIKGSWLQRSCVIYAGKSSTIIAQMHKKQTANLFAKDTSIVTISPGIDYAFIVALIVILDAINLDNGD
ncbi:hypothetical protein L3X38_035095 [Prunus dulcis]|uniref:Uncharacterized protein n=1 Tax=Prunus dulcis TaxID=3755 RepID=A0AAD4VK27_PRUDU|nr:hypothetical protein L3X38_035095 [Prunus dulcis]